MNEKLRKGLKRPGDLCQVHLTAIVKRLGTEGRSPPPSAPWAGAAGNPPLGPGRLFPVASVLIYNKLLFPKVSASWEWFGFYVIFFPQMGVCRRNWRLIGRHILSHREVEPERGANSRHIHLPLSLVSGGLESCFSLKDGAAGKGWTALHTVGVL